MSSLERIISLLEAQKKDQKDLCAYLGLGKSTFTEWKAGRNESYKKYLPRIAEYLGVSVNDLVGTEPTAQDPKITILSRAARHMTEEEKSKLIDMAKLLFQKAFDEADKENK